MFAPVSYEAVRVAGAGPWQLIDDLYRGALRRIDEGQLEKARAIVSEGLFASLNPSLPLSRGLADVYEVVLLHLGPGGSPATARQMLELLHEAWCAIEPGRAAQPPRQLAA
jgi:flagellin-specific chaperone FliS